MNSRLVNTVWGFDLWLSTDDVITKLLLQDKIFEAPESELVIHIVRPNDICVDAGCQVGYYTCLLARLVGKGGRVYSFDANPDACEVTRYNLAHNNMLCAEVIQAALADRNGEVAFHLSSDDQTGLSSLGPIAECKAIITVPCLRLEDFLNERKVEHVQLLKIDVEGSEEIVLRGLGHFLTDHRVDFILAECYDERLQLLNTSTERVWTILRTAGYSAWEYRGFTGWSTTNDVRSRADCNYLFASPLVGDLVPQVSIAGALITAKEALVLEQREIAALRQSLDKSRSHNSELLALLNSSDDEVARLRQENRSKEEVLRGLQSSAGWRLLNHWRRMRDVIAPKGSFCRRVYDIFVDVFRN